MLAVQFLIRRFWRLDTGRRQVRPELWRLADLRQLDIGVWREVAFAQLMPGVDIQLAVAMIKHEH